MPAPRATRMALAMQREVALLAAAGKNEATICRWASASPKGSRPSAAIGFPGRMDYGAIGNVTNLAARLCGEAHGGEILIAQRVVAQLDGAFRTETAGELTLKGFQRAVPAFRLIPA